MSVGADSNNKKNFQMNSCQRAGYHQRYEFMNKCFKDLQIDFKKTHVMRGQGANYGQRQMDGSIKSPCNYLR